VGEVGEIFIGGGGPAPGYLNQPVPVLEQEKVLRPIEQATGRPLTTHEQPAERFAPPLDNRQTPTTTRCHSLSSGNLAVMGINHLTLAATSRNRDIRFEPRRPAITFSVS
jgi:hypothetical protein